MYVCMYVCMYVLYCIVGMCDKANAETMCVDVEGVLLFIREWNTDRPCTSEYYKVLLIW